MKNSMHLLLAFICCCFFTNLQAQSPATAKGASILSGMFSFTSRGGDLYVGGGDRTTNITFAPAYMKFVADRFSVGGEVFLSYSSFGNANLTSYGIGPKAAYFFDNGSTTLPFVSFGASFFGSDFSEGDNNTGFQVKPSGGVVIRKGHIGFVFEGGVEFDGLKRENSDERVWGNIIFVAVGINAFLFKEE